MKSKVEKELNKKNKIFDFKGLLKNIVSNNSEKESVEEDIENNPELSDDVKKALIDCYKSVEESAKRIDFKSVVHFETRKVLGSVRNGNNSKRNIIKENKEENKTIDEDLIK